MKSTRYLLVPLLLTLIAGSAAAGEPPPVKPGDLLASTGEVGDSLISVDPATGAGTFRFPLGTFGPVTEIEYRADGVLFATTGHGTGNLITIDPDTGVETLIGNHGIDAVNGLEFVGDVLYGTSFGNGTLVIVDQTDGSLTDVGTLAFIPVRGLAYDEKTGTMYGVARNNVAAGVGTGDDVLITIDLATAACTLVGGTGFTSVGGLEFGPDGKLYGGLGQTAAGAERAGAGGDLITLDPATGLGTLVGASGFPAISGLAFVPGLVFADGFESGDTSAWSQTVP